MKKYLLFVSFLVLSLLLISCGYTADPDEMLSDFLLLYGAEGVVYTSDAGEGEEGYISPELFSSAFRFYNTSPKSFALFLNSHTDSASECGVFVCRDGAEREAVTEACLERMSLLSAGENKLLLVSRNIVFYSTMTEKDRARDLWSKILASHT